MIFSEETLLRGRKLVNKIWNVSKFIEMHLQDYEDKEFKNYEYIDKWISLGKTDEELKEAFEKTVLNTGKLSFPYMDKILTGK